MDDCLFCKIANKEIPKDILYEDEMTVAFLDIHPNNPGHTLVIPKQHSANYIDTAPETLASMARNVQKIGSAIMKAVNAPGFNIAVNNGTVAGQVIHHLHWHIIPRFENDGYKMWPGKSYEEGEEEIVAGKIREQL